MYLPRPGQTFLMRLRIRHRSRIADVHRVPVLVFHGDVLLVLDEAARLLLPVLHNQLALRELFLLLREYPARRQRLRQLHQMRAPILARKQFEEALRLLFFAALRLAELSPQSREVDLISVRHFPRRSEPIPQRGDLRIPETFL